MTLLISKEDKEQAGSLVFKSVLGFLPGGHIIDELSEFRTNVHKERLNKFCEFLKEGFEEITEKSLDPENLKTEHFIDVFEIVIKRVISTSSNEKLKRLRNVLLKEMFEMNGSEIFLRNVNFIDSISETQVLILRCISRFNTKLSEIDIAKQLDKSDRTRNTLENIQIGDFLFISRSELKFFINDLKNKGLLDWELQSASGSPNEFFKINSIGSDFLWFIREQGKDT